MIDIKNISDDLLVRLVRAYTNESALDLSKRIGLSGQSHISRLENGKKRLSNKRRLWFEEELGRLSSILIK